MLNYAFVIDDRTFDGEATIIFQEVGSQGDPADRWHYFDTVKRENALLFVQALNENEQKQLSQ